MTIDYKKVAETLKRNVYSTHVKEHEAAIVLCLLAAKLPVGEAERVLEAAVGAAKTPSQAPCCEKPDLNANEDLCPRCGWRSHV